MTIQWFPGHMTKAKRQVTEKLKQIDLVLELLDARIPYSSRNPMLDEMIADKPRLVILNKADMADKEQTTRWQSFYKDQGIETVAIDAQSGKGVQQIPERCQDIVAPMFKAREEKGLRPRAIRALIVGIPNVGKSSLINRLANRHIAKTGDRPGITKAQQWIKVGKRMELLDTPGILWPKFEDEAVGLRLAASGAIKDEILHKDDVALFAIAFLKQHYPQQMMDRYKLEAVSEDNVQMLYEIGRKRGCLRSGGVVDYDKASEIILHDLRSGKLGNITFEKPGEAHTR